MTGQRNLIIFCQLLFPDEELQILGYNRVIRDLNGRTPEELLRKRKRYLRFAVCRVR
ncbi:MAG: DUF1015 family protein [Lachnospiraceae bacterium]